jgi:hypothetical protein
MGRKSVDCRKMPSENHCDLKMSGTEEHLIPAAVHHAVVVHGHTDSPELREAIKGMLEDEND